MTMLDLFSGIGGFSLAAQWAGIETIGFCEIDPYASAVLKKHWPNVKNYGDIRNVPTIKCDVITCGDPCQRNSNAWRHGNGKESPAVYALQIIKNCKPDFVLRENPSRIRRDAPWPWWRFRKALEDIGYAVLPVRLRACCFGADHQRERMWLLAQIPYTNSTGLEGDVREILERANQGRQNPNPSRPDWGNPASRISGAIDGIPNRMDRIKSIGNAVVPQVAYQILKVIKAIHDSTEGEK